MKRSENEGVRRLYFYYIYYLIVENYYLRKLENLQYENVVPVQA